MSRYIRKTAKIDPERGDALTLRREDIAALYDPNFPVDARREILDAVCQWFCSPQGEEAPHLENPLSNAILQTLISRQKKKVGDFIDRCDQYAKNRTKGDNGQPRSTIVTNIKKEKEKDKDEEMKSLSFSERENRAPVDTAPVSLDSVEDAKKLLMMLAPPVDGKHYSKESIDTLNDLMPEDEDDAVKAVMNETKESKADAEQRKFSANTYRKFYRELGRDLFVRAYLRLSTDIANEDEQYGNSDDSEDMSRYPADAIARNPAKVFTARLKRLKDAAAATN